MKNSLHKILILAFILGINLIPTSNIWANDSNIEGYWLTLDDNTSAPSSIIRLERQSNSQLAGKIHTLFHKSGENAEQIICSKCSSDTKEKNYGLNKGEKVLGSFVTWGFSQSDNIWKNGKIVQIKTGKKYTADLKLRTSNQLDITIHSGMFSKDIYWKKITQKQIDSICKGDISSLDSTQKLTATCI